MKQFRSITNETKLQVDEMVNRQNGKYSKSQVDKMEIRRNGK